MKSYKNYWVFNSTDNIAYIARIVKSESYNKDYLLISEIDDLYYIDYHTAEVNHLDNANPNNPFSASKLNITKKREDAQKGLLRLIFIHT